MKRLHLHVSVPDLAQSIRFYETLFGAPPSVVKDDYAKWMLDDPRVNFAISVQASRQPGVDHVGIQVDSAAELGVLAGRLNAAGNVTFDEAATTCCYAKSDKHWVQDPSGIAWETFHTLASVPVFGMPAKKPGAKPVGIPVASAKSEVASSCCAPGAADKQGSSCC